MTAASSHMRTTEQGRTEAFFAIARKRSLLPVNLIAAISGFIVTPTRSYWKYSRALKRLSTSPVIHSIRYQDPDTGLIKECLLMAEQDRFPAYLYGIIINTYG